jgi:hypothetical protein
MDFNVTKSFPRQTTNQMFFLTLALVGCVLTTSLALPFLDTRNAHSSSTVDLGYSRFQGTLLSSGISQYLGMRYASPPLGQNRFRAPQPPQNTNTTQIAQAVCIVPVVLVTWESITYIVPVQTNLPRHECWFALLTIRRLPFRQRLGTKHSHASFKTACLGFHSRRWIC